MTEREYAAAPGIRRSELWLINKSPMHFKYAKERPEEPTKAMKFGSAIHKFVLDAQNFQNEYIVAPNIDRRTKAGKEAYADLIGRSVEENMDIISEEEYLQICEMTKVLAQDPIASMLLHGEREQSFFWVDGETQERCKIRCDVLTTWDGKPYIVDYKTTDSCEPGHFERSMKKYGYKLQAGMYHEGLFENKFEDYGFAFVAQEKTEPYAVNVYVCDPEYIKEGVDLFRELLGIYHYCKMNNNWYGYMGAEHLVTEVLAEGY